MPYEDTFCAVLEQQLDGHNALDGRRAEVLGFGVSGYGTAQELLMLGHYVWQYEPDIVLLAFFAGNDLQNNSAELEPYKVRPFYRLQGDDLSLDDAFRQHPDYLKACSTAVQLKVALINRCRMLQLLDESRRQWRQRGGTDQGGQSSQAGVSNSWLAEPQDEASIRAWEVTERLIVEMNQRVRAHGAQFFLVAVTAGVQVHPDRGVREAASKQLDVEDLFYSELRLESLGEGNDFPVVTLAESMQRTAAETGTFFHGFNNSVLGEGHWNANGHREAATLVAGAIRWGQINGQINGAGAIKRGQLNGTGRPVPFIYPRLSTPVDVADGDNPCICGKVHQLGAAVPDADITDADPVVGACFAW